MKELNKITWGTVTKFVKRRHCISAMEQIDKTNVPKGREWETYYIHFKNAKNIYKNYPPKYVIELAFNIAAKELNTFMRLTSNDFSEGPHVKEFLESLHFDVFIINKK